ncbi:helix-turn-helix domain-containing protein [Acidobacteria bacterium AH-259-D05]|nr:helix-turn-helix domain-containing protein [Acidobacteria bacterium AH-259-D05]
MSRVYEILSGTVTVQEILAYLQSDYYMTKRDLSRYLSVSLRTIENLMVEIPHYKLGRRVLFRKNEIDQWMMQYHQAPNISELKELANEAMAALEEPGRKQLH